MFEQDLADNVLSVTIENHPTVLLELVEAEYEHPPAREASSGSSVMYTFAAFTGRL